MKNTSTKIHGFRFIAAHFFASGESRFSIPKIRRPDFLCVSPTFASPIKKPATSAHRRICREIIGNTEENTKTVDSLRRGKWTNSTSKSAPETKKPTGLPVGGELKKWSTIFKFEPWRKWLFFRFFRNFRKMIVFLLDKLPISCYSNLLTEIISTVRAGSARVESYQKIL